MESTDEQMTNKQAHWEKDFGEKEFYLHELVHWLLEPKINLKWPGIEGDEIGIKFENGVLTISPALETTGKALSGNPNQIIARSPKTRFALALARRLALNDEAVILQGPVGSGRHLFARWMHEQSSRKNDPFIRLSCAAMISSEQWQKSLAEVGQGTLYLEDIDELSPELIDCFQQLSRGDGFTGYRLMAAARSEPQRLRKMHELLETFLHPLQAVYIELLPLAERPEDIVPLAEYHLGRKCAEKNLERKKMSPEFLQMLEIYRWPGNVRELINTLDQALITAQEKKSLFGKDLPTHIRIQAIRGSAARKKGL